MVKPKNILVIRGGVLADNAIIDKSASSVNSAECPTRWQSDDLAVTPCLYMRDDACATSLI